jgi:hypothetical protein
MMTPRIGAVPTESSCGLSGLGRSALTFCLWFTFVGFGHSGNPASSWQTVYPDTNHAILLRSWSLSSLDQRYANISTTTPGDLLSDLMEARLVEDPYIDRNFLSQRQVWLGDDERGGVRMEQRPDPTIRMPQSLDETKMRSRTWVYSTRFDILDDFDRRTNPLTWMVILEGVKMGAEVHLNGVSLGLVQDQFLRYEFLLPDDVLSRGVPFNRSRRHELTISFPPSIHVDGRFTASSGGWDWAPYVRVRDGQGTRMYTLGIVKPVYVIGIERFAITHVVPKVNYLGPYPRIPLREAEGDFRLDVDVHLAFVHSANFSAASKAETLSLTLEIESGNQVERQGIPQTGTMESGVVTLSIIVNKGDVALWWPNGMGEQPLYNISIAVMNSEVIIRKRIGKKNGLYCAPRVWRVYAYICFNHHVDVYLICLNFLLNQDSG